MIDEVALAAPGQAHSPQAVDAGLVDVLRSFVRSSVSFGRHPGESLERLAQSLCSRIVHQSLDHPRPIRDLPELQAALAQKSRSFDSTGVAVVTKAVLTRIGPMKFLARRTPWLLAASAVPDMYSSLVRGREEVAIVSSFLVHRAGDADTDVDAERLRRVTVQLLLRRKVDPGAEPDDADLVSSWARRALKSALPFVKGGGTPHSRAIAAAADTVDPSLLRRG